MRITATILFLMFFCNVYGQKWHLNRIDKNSKFMYEYWFQFDHADDTSTYNFEKREGNLNSTIHLTNNKGDKVILAIIRIIGVDNDTELNLDSDFDGLGTVKLKPGKYRIDIFSWNYDNFSLEFTIAEDEYFDLNVKLGLAPESTVYQINSTHELTENEILIIINCVKENKKDFYKMCSESENYIVLMHI